MFVVAGSPHAFTAILDVWFLDHTSHVISQFVIVWLSLSLLSRGQTASIFATLRHKCCLVCYLDFFLRLARYLKLLPTFLRLGLMDRQGERYRNGVFDGLTDLVYDLNDIQFRPLYTWIHANLNSEYFMENFRLLNAMFLPIKLLLNNDDKAKHWIVLKKGSQ